MDVYRSCLENSDSVTIIRDHIDNFGMFNNIEQTKSFAFVFDRSCTGSIRTSLSSSLEPICIEVNIDSNSTSPESCGTGNDLIIKQFSGGEFKYRFNSFWPTSDYDISKMEIMKVT